ncbi:MAG TPA: HisA/HisF-related TIM barrel protein [Myxococcota bacterium]|jgi:phosphoribosylformimino-5-aminoimidazole carboxamide ribotide isomerase|nr:HisA/HisF-related TIM barrel protein [Myxococcota bacterium]
MRVIPAIDLRGGAAVRLRQGESTAATGYGDPLERVRAFVAAGATRLHVVDLDGAFAGAALQAALVGRIVAAAGAGVEVQVGGGIRDAGTAEAYLAQGAAAVILGTAAVEAPEVFADCCRRFSGKILAGIDARGGCVAVRGWTQNTALDAPTLAARLAGAGAAGIVYTDIARDGTGAGPNVGATAALAAAVSIPVFASGGVSTIDHIGALCAARNIAGVVVGRALYEGTLDLRAAFALADGAH